MTFSSSPHVPYILRRDLVMKTFYGPYPLFQEEQLSVQWQKSGYLVVINYLSGQPRNNVAG